jgi:hypothetical protein
MRMVKTTAIPNWKGNTGIPPPPLVEVDVVVDSVVAEPDVKVSVVVEVWLAVLVVAVLDVEL